MGYSHCNLAVIKSLLVSMELWK